MSALLYQLYQGALHQHPDMSPVLESLSEAFGAEQGFLHQHLLGHRHQGRIIATAHMPSEFVLSYEDHFSALNPFMLNGDQRFKAGASGTGEGLMDYDLLQESEFYRKWMAPQRIHHTMGATLQRQGNRVLNMTFTRPKNAAPFKAHDRIRLNKLIPHLQLALEVHALRHELHASRSALKHTLEALSIGAMVLNAQTEPILINSTAQNLLRQREGLLSHPPHGAWSALRRQNSKQLRELIHGCCEQGRVGSIQLQRNTKQRPLEVWMCPVGTERAESDIVERSKPVALMFLCDPERSLDALIPKLQSTHGLSPAQARVVVLLIQGHTEREVAQALGIQHSTVKTHLRRIKDKTGTRKNLELVSLVLLGTAGL